MARFLNPFTDVGFKKMFGQEVHKDLLISFLNALLAGERVIRDIQYLDKEIPPDFEGDRGTIFDIYCTAENGDHFIVEMQNNAQDVFADRALYYLSRSLARQGERGVKWAFKLKAVYGVFFMNFRLSTSLPDRLRTDAMLLDCVTHQPVTDKLRMIFLQLPAFNKSEEECSTDLERWIYVLKHMEALNRLPFSSRNAVFKRLEQIMDIAALSKAEREKYDATIDAYRDQLAVMNYAKKEGEALGVKKVALRMAQKGYSLDEIMEATGLDADTISRLS